ncbi:unnamed protein product [Blepharisma stoltei]|uniref:Cation-transporting P-type ATPase N-terminal domain-containing protein n=1 Tax=Blepharisma stoltei TaxID=1481888 RepID=A0AAU9JWK0_9CILI|nr:unnamed protein product [Blepharisma stoltei]
MSEEDGFSGIDEKLKDLTWHKMTPEELSWGLETDLNEGLTQEKALKKLKIFGENCLYDRDDSFKRIFKHVLSPLTIFIYIAAIFSYFAYRKGYVSYILYSVLPIIAIIISTITLVRNEQSRSDLKSADVKIPQKCAVIRNARDMAISRYELVPGDIVKFRSGDTIPADLRILSANDLKVDIECFTDCETILPRSEKCTSQNFLQSENIVYFGSLCAMGMGKGVVVGTGKNTLLFRLVQV